MKRAPSITIRCDEVTSEAYVVLGELAGYGRHEALGRMVMLRAWCRGRVLQDAPDGCPGYAVTEATVLRFLGPRGVTAILADGHGDLALGARWSEGLVLLTGTEGEVAAVRELVRKAKLGARARGQGPRHCGKFVTVNHPKTTLQGGARVAPGWQIEASTSSPLALAAAPAPPETALVLTSPAVAGAPPPRRGRPPRASPADATLSELESVRLVLAKLGERNGVTYRAGAEHVRLIVGHLRAGVSELDLRIVIKYCAERLEWQGKPEMEPYLRPETLFGPRSIAKYLDPALSWFASLPPDGR